MIDQQWLAVERLSGQSIDASNHYPAPDATMSARADATEPLFEPAFDALHHVVSRLRSAEVLRMDHDDFERLIEVEGRDVLRLLL
ncbi:MAG: hypothetical protein GXP62_13705 [Oligoflexia bacterium]|nr:hypothetical protein [Oligoflexia bacterium]